eukprot:864632-Rhodomonas_salina.1
MASDMDSEAGRELTRRGLLERPTDQDPDGDQLLFPEPLPEATVCELMSELSPQKVKILLQRLVSCCGINGGCLSADIAKERMNHVVRFIFLRADDTVWYTNFLGPRAIIEQPLNLANCRGNGPSGLEFEWTVSIKKGKSLRVQDCTQPRKFKADRFTSLDSLVEMAVMEAMVTAG